MSKTVVVALAAVAVAVAVAVAAEGIEEHFPCQIPKS